jgi:hypothetical protein
VLDLIQATGARFVVHIIRQRLMLSAQFECVEINLSHPRDRVCEQCSKPFRMRNPSGKARLGKTKEGRFCSRACSASSMRLYASRSEARRARKNRSRLRSWLPPLPAPPDVKICNRCASTFKPRMGRQQTCGAEACRKAANRASSNLSSRLKDKRDRKPRCCRECGKEFAPEYGDKSRIYCSALCCARSTKRIRRKKERARLRTALVEAVNPTVVFDRDRWRCQACRCATPRTLRGSIKPNAPELESYHSPQSRR